MEKTPFLEKAESSAVEKPVAEKLGKFPPRLSCSRAKDIGVGLMILGAAESFAFLSSYSVSIALLSLMLLAPLLCLLEMEEGTE
jgi:hypothetical protein